MSFTPPEISYTRSGEVHLAYQVIGDGPTNLLLAQASFVPISMTWDYPPLAELARRLSGLGRLIMFDRRGVGFSDPVAEGSAGTTEELAADMWAVLDAAGLERAALIGDGFTAAAVVAAATSQPERVDKLILVCLLYTSPSPRDATLSRMPSSA